MDSHDDLDDLLLELNHLDEIRRQAAYSLLVSMGEEIVPALVGDFARIAGAARLSVIRALGEIRDPRAVPLLLDLMQSDDLEEYLYVSSFAAKSLRQIGDATAVAGLVSTLSHERPGPRRMAATVLGSIGDAAAIPALVAALKDPDFHTQAIAAKALRKIGTEDALKAVEAWERKQ